MRFKEIDPEEVIECECSYCGKTFNKGDEGDNERMCLRCERITYLEESQEDRLWEDDYDFDDDLQNEGR